MSELAMTVHERADQLNSLLGRKAYFDGLQRIIGHTLQTGAEAGFALTHTAGKYRSYFVNTDPDVMVSVLAELDMPEDVQWRSAYGSVRMGSAVFGRHNWFRPGLVSMARSHPTEPGQNILDSLTPSPQDLDISHDLFTARPHAAMVIAAANDEVKRAFVYCRSSTKLYVPRYQQLDGPEYSFNTLNRVLGESGVKSAVLDISTFDSYKASLDESIPGLAS